MPFDGKKTEETVITYDGKTSVSSDPKQNIRTLIKALREQDKWEKELKLLHWDFTEVLQFLSVNKEINRREGEIMREPYIERSYYECGTKGCAMGLASMIWIGARETDKELTGISPEAFMVDQDYIRAILGMTQLEFNMVFYEISSKSITSGSIINITPGMVADQLETFL